MAALTAEQFDKQISEVTRISLNELITRKQEKNRCQRAEIKAVFFLMVMFIIFLLYTSIMKPTFLSYFTLGSLQMLASDPIMLLCGASMLFGFMQIQYYSKKYKEADNDYESLRCELIDRSEELWPNTEQWNNRHLFFAFMNEEYDINLYFK